MTGKREKEGNIFCGVMVTVDANPRKFLLP
jgi:hypothetical protein